MVNAFLDQVVTYAFPESTKSYRVFLDDYGPLVPNPEPNGRLAMVKDTPTGAQGRGGMYLSSTTAGAIWETVLQGLYPDAAQRLMASRRLLNGRSIVLLRAKCPQPMIDLTLPARLNLFVNRNPQKMTRAGALWQLVLESDNHVVSHRAAAAIATVAQASGTSYAGLTWISARHQHSEVHLLYAPPFKHANWNDVPGTCVSLSTPAGEALVRQAVRQARMQPVFI